MLRQEFFMKFINHAQILKFYREKHGITQVQLGDRTNTSPNTIGVYENSPNKILSQYKCERFAEVLEIPKTLFSEIADKMRMEQMNIVSNNTIKSCDQDSLPKATLETSKKIVSSDKICSPENTLVDKDNTDDYILKRLAGVVNEYIADLVKTKDIEAINELNQFIFSQAKGRKNGKG